MSRVRLRQVISIPDDDEKSPAPEQESKKNGEEPMETDKPSNGDSDEVKEKEAESEKKSPEAAEETKTEGSEVKPEEPEVKGERRSLATRAETQLRPPVARVAGSCRERVKPPF